MAIASDIMPSASRRLASALTTPSLWLVAAIVCACLLLSLPLSAPICPMYWDVYLYYDAANRIFDGQTPIVDFFAPVGPLGYYLFAGGAWLFPNAQPTLLAHWSLLVVTAPLMAIVVGDVDRRSRPVALMLLAPFLLYALLPFNTREFSSFPGSDGFGIYNRQVCQLLYVLVAALLFMRDARRLAAVIALCMIALFFLKITGFVAAGVICAFAFLAGRVSLRSAVSILAAFTAALAIAELFAGMVSRYVTDIADLVEMNSGTLLPRFLQSTSVNFGIVLPAAALLGVLLWLDRAEFTARFAKLARERKPAAAAALADHPALWLAAILFAGILFETQNTGSQALIFLAPVALAILVSGFRFLSRPAPFMVVGALCAAMALTPALKIVERAARAYIGALKNEPLEAGNLRTLGHLNMRSEVAVRAEHMLRFYPDHLQEYEDMVAVGELPTPSLYADFDFQIVYLNTVDQAIDSIRALEAQKNVRFETIMSLNFTNPFPWLMERSAPRAITIGADPFRAVPPMDAEVEKSVADTDLILDPRCPPTTANAELKRIYGAGMAHHFKVRLNECYDAYVHPKFAGRLPPQ